MSMTRTNIANLALRELGATRVDDYDEDSFTGDILRDVWEQGVRKALARAEWEFAKKRRKLSQANADFGNEYDYSLPSDFVRLIAVYDDEDMDTPLWDGQFERVGGVLNSDCEKLYIKYVYYYDTVGGWPPWFIDVLVADLASVMASPLKSSSERERLEDLAVARLRDAKSQDGTQKPTVMLPASRWVQAMRGANAYDQRYGPKWR